MTFQPGQSGNPAGRPRGSRNARAWIALRRRCGAAPRCEGGMLLHAVWMKAVNPENWILDTTADAISPIVLGSCMTRRSPSAPRAGS